MDRGRPCKQCGGLFALNAPGAGTKYCSPECKRSGYSIRVNPIGSIRCAWCDQVRKSHAAWHGSVWPYVCQACIEPIRHVADRLKAHRVSLDRARRLIDDPWCEICGRNLLEVVRDFNYGKRRSPLVVDHDHDCCPGAHSCGKCVRGLICVACNSGIGMIMDSAQVALSMAYYLENGNGLGSILRHGHKEEKAL